MKPCNLFKVLQFRVEGPRPCTFFSDQEETMIHPLLVSAEYFNTNVSIGQLVQHITKSTVVCPVGK